MLKAFSFFAVLFAASIVHAQVEDPELEKLQWNRWTTDNFTILSIDVRQGDWLYRNIEQIKSWCVTRWGFPDYKFTRECRIMCVPNRELMKRLFSIENSRFEKKLSDNGQLEMTMLWVVLDQEPASVIPPLLTRACLVEFEQAHRTHIGFWAKIGMSRLNGDLVDIRQALSDDETVYMSKSLFAMTEDDYRGFDDVKKKAFDKEAMFLCLLLRKEFGETKMQGFMRLNSRNSQEDSLRVIYGFNNYKQFDRSFKRYISDLSSDIKAKKTPDEYLIIKPVDEGI